MDEASAGVEVGGVFFAEGVWVVLAGGAGAAVAKVEEMVGVFGPGALVEFGLL